MEPARGNDEFVTIVAVGNSGGANGAPRSRKSSETIAEVPFVTVLSIGQPSAEEQVTVYRLPGEKLGFGLKFEGGTKSAERVRRLFIQSCAAESPAGRARAAWGHLVAGDEILRIDGVPVTALTRLECVRCLKDSNVAVNLLVRHFAEGDFQADETAKLNLATANGTVSDSAEVNRSGLPPPVPPRKIPRRGSKDPSSDEMRRSSSNEVLHLIETKDAKKTEGHLKSIDGASSDSPMQLRKGPLGKQSPGRPRRPAPVHTAPPPEAQVYTDLFCHEKENGFHVAESESDDTGSSISTVIDRLSAYSSFPGSVENSIPSTPTLGYKQIDINNVLSCIENMDENFITDLQPNALEDKSRKNILKSSSFGSSDKLNRVLVSESITSNGYSNVQVIREERKRSTDSNTDDPILLIESKGVPCVIDISQNTRSDANNNTKDSARIAENSVVKSVDLVDFASSSDAKVVKNLTALEMPKPLPRNLNKKNIDSHTRHDYVTERLYEDNLSPTKLHCIETWLQDSIGCKISSEPRELPEEEREVMRPEALPRLIDFVPKMQFSMPTKSPTDTETHGEKPVASDRTKSTPKPKTTEKEKENLHIVITKDTNQDWFGSAGSPQLETIYEDLSTCPTLLIEETARHPPAGDSGSDRGASHDGGELRQPEPPLNPHSGAEPATRPHIVEESGDSGVVIVTRGPRPPPDGRENPAAHHEEPPAPPPHKYRTQLALPAPPAAPQPKESKMVEHMVRSLSYESPTRHAKAAVPKSYGRGKDAKSEGSVKDKIAMFSVNKTSDAPSPANADRRTSSSGSRPADRSTAPAGRASGLHSEYISKSQENLLDFSNRSMNDTYGSSKSYSVDWSSSSVQKPPPVYIEPPKPSLPSSKPPDEYPNYQVDEPKICPIVMLNRALSVPERSSKTDATKNSNHRSTIDYLIEQRRKTMAKLRGLVIPDSPSISNLPEIRSRDSLKLLSTSILEENKKTTSRPLDKSKPAPQSPTMLTMWDSQSIINNVPKYSPAFKRKPLQVYGPKMSTTLVTSALPKYSDGADEYENGKLNEPHSSLSLRKISAPSKPPRTSLDMKKSFDLNELSQKVNTLPSNFRSTNSVINLNVAAPSSKSRMFSSDAVDHSSLKMLKTFPETADSDNDSAVSSTQSSYLSTVSSPTPSINTVDNTESDCSSQSILSQDVTLHSQNNYANLFSKNDEGLFTNGFNHNLLQLDERKRDVCRSLSSDTSTSAGSSNSSTLTSGSQASCSSAGSSNTDTGSHRVLKPRSIEAINRKNILASAKCRSGKDNKFGSPLIERKFSDDSNVESTDEYESSKKSETQFVSKELQHLNGEKPKFTSTRSRSRVESSLANSILKVAYSNLVVEDKMSKKKKGESASTCSDTGSDSDIEVIKIIKLDVKPNKHKKYSNGAPADRTKQHDANPARRQGDNYAKTAEQAKVKRSIENSITNANKASSNSAEVARHVVSSANGSESKSAPKSESHKAQRPPKEVALTQEAPEDKEEQDGWCEVRLARGTGGLGVTLAGGADCEAQEVTIHKVLQGSAAERDGRLCKGDKVISINGRPMKGVTHAQSVAILKDPQQVVSIVIKGNRPKAEHNTDIISNSNGSAKVISVNLIKEDTPGGAGLGISLEGGGNNPLLINKLFTGGPAARSGQIVSGSELLAAGEARLSGLTRTEAWGLLRALPAGPVSLVLRPP